MHITSQFLRPGKVACYYLKKQIKKAGSWKLTNCPPFYEIERELKMSKECEISTKLLFDFIHYVEQERQKKKKRNKETNETMTVEEIEAYYKQLYNTLLLLEETILDF